MTISTLTIAKSVSITDYQPAFREKATANVWPWTDVFEVGTTRRGQEKYFGYAGLPLAQQRGELSTYPVYDITELGETTLSVVKFMLAARVSREAIQDNQHIRGLVREIGTMLGESHQQVIDQFATQPFNRATNSTYAMHDGVELCGTHTLEDGATYDNYYTATSLTYDNFWDDLVSYEWGYRTHSGLRQFDQIAQVMIAPDQIPEMTKILQNSKEPDTADNNDSFIPRGIKMIVNPYLSTSTWRFLIGKKFKAKAKFLWRERMQTDEEPDRDTQGVKFMAFQRCGIAVIDYLPIALNPGL
jgi:hypothetical protein